MELFMLQQVGRLESDSLGCGGRSVQSETVGDDSFGGRLRKEFYQSPFGSYGGVGGVVEDGDGSELQVLHDEV